MFERMIRELGELSRTKEISVPIEADAEGYLDRECPVEACMFSFKVLSEDWTNVVRDEEVFCPMCRHSAPSKSWFTTAQVEMAQKYAMAHLQGRLGQAMREDARAWNARQQSGFLRITMDVRGAPKPLPIPIAAGEPMRLKATCDCCGCRYSYIGSAFFCPACGHNSATRTFEQTLAAVRAATEIDRQLRAALSADDAEMTARLLREKGLGDVVMAIQRLAERIWEAMPESKPAPRNTFQRLDDASKLWLTATGRDFLAFLTEQEFERLRIGYQRRHLLAHREGMVDADYVRKSGDTTLAVGQRVTINAEFLLEFVALAEKLGHGLLESLPAQPGLAQEDAATRSPPSVSVSSKAAVGDATRARAVSGYSDDAQAIARLLVTRSRYGRHGDPMLPADAVRQATGLNDEDIAEAVYELECRGLVFRHQAMGMESIGFHLLCPEPGLFQVFDPILGMGDPVADARTLAAALLDGGDGAESSQALAEREGWTARRANPALDWLIAHDLVLASETIDPVWTTVWIRRKPGLRTFVQQGTK